MIKTYYAICRDFPDRIYEFPVRPGYWMNTVLTDGYHTKDGQYIDEWYELDLDTCDIYGDLDEAGYNPD